ncbi:M13 family metallopeptidase [Niveispirillum sp. KHB5.9]|uniref:M13 family metallopeptidase n=1 Tax=Niveispirillum sp. KHB5.9 TaxID=3400269 RepID=UPI003A86A8B5
MASKGLWLTVSLVAVAAIGAGSYQILKTQQQEKAAAEAAKMKLVLDQEVNPCDDFFLHACGPWIKANPIPADRSRWGTFDELQQRNQDLLHTILEKAAKGDEPGTAKIGAFYAACMDEAAADAAGVAPVKPLLDQIAAVTDKRALGTLLATLHNAGVNALFGFGAQQSFAKAEDTIAAFDQGGLGLPDRDYYFKDDERSTKLRDAYVKHVAAIFVLAGDSVDLADKKAAAVMALETRLATGTMSKVDRRDTEKLNNPGTFAAFSDNVKGVDFATYVKDVGAPAFTDMNVNDPGFFANLDKVLAETSLDDIKIYLSWQTLRATAPWLSKGFVDENFGFYGKTLSGAAEIRPRWKRCTTAADTALGEDLGKHFIEAAFGPEHKKRMLVMLDDLRAAYAEDIKGLDWMSDETKVKAQEKLAAMAQKIGYPEKWREYAALDVEKGDLIGNQLRSAKFENAYQLAKIGKKVDKNEWFMTPPTVNAYYDPSQNNINFPAGILQPPFFDFQADDGLNYGAIGAVIGHEMTHGFDDEGRAFDAVGNLKDWWTEEDGHKFEAKAQCLVDQYGSYQVAGDTNQNGKLTLGENTADNGGLRLALMGLKARLGGDAALTKKDANGVTAEQKLFYGWASVWCSSSKPENERLRAQTDPHSAPRHRVNGTVANMPEFAKAFNCKPTDKMVRGDKACKVW